MPSVGLGNLNKSTTRPTVKLYSNYNKTLSKYGFIKAMHLLTNKSYILVVGFVTIITVFHF